jgi:hypothetical protein
MEKNSPLFWARKYSINHETLLLFVVAVAAQVVK